MITPSLLNVSLINCFKKILFVLLVGVKIAALMHQSVEGRTEVRPIVEERPLTEQQLGLRQAEERLYRDYIHRLLNVRKQSSHSCTVNVRWSRSFANGCPFKVCMCL